MCACAHNLLSQIKSDEKYCKGTVWLTTANICNSLSTCVIIEAIQALIPWDDVTLKHENRADWICLAEEIPNLIRNAGDTPILCLTCLDLRETYSI